MDNRICFVTLGVSDLARARAFYEALGWKSSPASQKSIIFFQGNGTVLALFDRKALAHDAGIADTPPGFSGVTLACNMGSREEVDALFARAVRHGAKSLKAPQDVFWGGYSSYVADPDGHLWEIAFNPFFPLDSDGRVQLSAGDASA